MARVRIEADVPDDFEKGDCRSCPFSYEQEVRYDEDEYDVEDRCCLCCSYENCLIEFVEVK